MEITVVPCSRIELNDKSSLFDTVFKFNSLGFLFFLNFSWKKSSEAFSKLSNTRFRVSNNIEITERKSRILTHMNFPIHLSCSLIKPAFQLICLPFSDIYRRNSVRLRNLRQDFLLPTKLPQALKLSHRRETVIMNKICI
jgi:hypothetical protein